VKNNCGKFLILLICSVIISYSSKAQEIKGKVTDGSTGESLVGAVIFVKIDVKTYTALSGLDGSFRFKNLPEGSYTGHVQYVGYEEAAIQIDSRKGSTTAVGIIRMKEMTGQMRDVIVNAAGNHENDRFARNSERSASNTLNIISAKAIQVSPDITVGNVLQRMPGVSVVKNSAGDGEYAIIRGMADRYNYTTINGIKLPSPDDKTHSVPMDIFPSDLLERLEVVKSLTPSMEGDAIGGATNMVLKDAPRQLTYALNGSIGYNNFFNTHTFSTFSHQGAAWQTPYEIHGPGYAPQPSDFNVKYLEYKNVSLPVNEAINGSIGNRITRKLGFLAAVSYQHIYKGNSSLFYPPGGQPQPIPTANTPVFGPIEYRTYSNLQNRLGLHLKLNYDLNDNNKLSLYTAYFQLDQTQHRNRQQGLSEYLHESGQDYVYDRSLFERKIIWLNTMQGRHKISDKWSADWSVVYAEAQSKIPIWIDQQYSDILKYDSTGKMISEQKNLQDFPFIYTHSKEIDRSGYANLHYSVSDGLVLSAGSMYRHKTRGNVYESYQLYAGNQPFTDIQDANFPRLVRVDTTDGLTYTSTENIAAAYGQAKWLHGKWEILAGLRIEHTNHSYWSELSIYLPGKTGSSIYTDYLPSLNIKYNLDEKNDLRASFFRGISRPNYFEYIPVTFSGDYYDQKGTDSIQRVQSNNVDVRYEHYFGAEDYVMVGSFYKYIINPIEFSFQQTTTSSFVLEPWNFGNATNYGAELIFLKHFRNFGVGGNYSYTKSSITTTKLVYGQQSNGNGYIVYNSTQTRPLQGQSNHIANLTLLYKSIRNGIEAQISWVYTGQRIEVVSPYKDLDYWQKASSQLDFSIEGKASRRITLFAKINNLTNEPLIQTLHTTANGYYFNNINYPDQNIKNAILVRKDVFNQSFFVGLRFR